MDLCMRMELHECTNYLKLHYNYIYNLQIDLLHFFSHIHSKYNTHHHFNLNNSTQTEAIQHIDYLRSKQDNNSDHTRKATRVF
jgi:hypothetical protein